MSEVRTGEPVLRRTRMAPPFLLLTAPRLYLPPMTAAILFDFNGVIVDDEPQHCDALIATLAEYGYALDRDTYYREYLGFDDRECFRFSFARMGRPRGRARAARGHRAEARRTTSAPSAQSMRLVPGAAEFVESAALDGFQLAIVSGALRREIELVLDLAGLRPHFAEIVAAEDVSACKPDPQGYNRAREALALAPNRCVVIEDSLPGLAAARAAGLRCAMLATSHGEDACADADLVWRDFTGHDARRAALGPCLSSTSGSTARGSTEVRHGATVVTTAPAVLRIAGPGRAGLPAGPADQRPREAGRRQPGLRRAAHAQGHDRGGRLGAPPGRHASR